MAAHGNVADQVDGLEHPCERLLLASLDIDLQQVDLFDAVLRYEMVQRDARDAMGPARVPPSVPNRPWLTLSDRPADDVRHWAPSWLYVDDVADADTGRYVYSVPPGHVNPGRGTPGHHWLDKGLARTSTGRSLFVVGLQETQEYISQLIGRLLGDEVPAGNADGAKVESPAAPDVGSVPELCLVLASDD
jgi:hypothetical protein